MQKFSTVILSENYSTAEVLKLYTEEFECLENLSTSVNGQEILDKLTAIEGKSIFIVDLTQNKDEKLDLILRV